MTDNPHRCRRGRWARDVARMAWGWACASPICDRFVIVVTDEDLWRAGS